MGSRPCFCIYTFTSPYTYLNGTLASTNGYVKDILFNSSIDYGFLATVVGGSGTSYLCDNYYQFTGNRVALLGGNWANGSRAGAFFWILDSASSSRSRYIGARLLYVATKSYVDTQGIALDQVVLGSQIFG